MAIKKIEEVYLYYTDLPGMVEKNFNAAIALDKANISFQRMQYGIGADLDELLKALNTWWKQPYVTLPPLSIDSFPFIVYTEVHDDIPARLSPVKFVEGLDAIKAFPNFYFSIGN
jgi:hypothetical protein